MSVPVQLHESKLTSPFGEDGESVVAEVWGKYPAGHDHELVVLAARPNKSHQVIKKCKKRM